MNVHIRLSYDADIVNAPSEVCLPKSEQWFATATPVPIGDVARAPLMSDPIGWHRGDQAASVMIVVGERT